MSDLLQAAQVHSMLHLTDGREKILMNQEEERVREWRSANTFFFHNIHVFELEN